MISFVLMALADVLTKMALERGVKAALPVIFDQIDDRLPAAVSEHLGSGVVGGLIAGAISDAIGRPARPSEIDTIVRLYDPRQAATKQARRVQRRSER
jgi:hypothetical protein